MHIPRLPPMMEDGSVVLLARIYTTDGVVAVLGDFSTITLDVYDTEDQVNAIASGVSLSPLGGYFFNSLRTDRDWTVNFDSTGYNFAYVTPASYLPTGGKLFRFQFVADFGGGRKTPFAWDVPTLDLIGR